MISFTGVTKRYGPVRALDGIDLSIQEAEFVALLGPSGCGKSTLLNLLAGFEGASEGRIDFAGSTIEKPGPDRAVVFQDAALLPWLSVRDNITFGLRMRGDAPASYEARTAELLSLVGLEGFEAALPSQLSGGMRQRVGLARALVMRPRALLMDEPFGALDAQTRLAMQQLLLDVWQSLRTTVLFVTHDIDEAILLADRVCVMTARPGRILRSIAIDLPRPRSLALLTQPGFMAYKADIMEALHPGR